MLPNKLQFKIFLGILFSFYINSAFSQDSSLIKVNYSFNYDRHDYSKGSYGREYVKQGFCYTNKLGLALNYYFFKHKRLGIGLQVIGGNKKMNLISDYEKMVDPTPYSDTQKTLKDYNFKYDYWTFGAQLRVSYFVRKRMDVFIGVEKNVAFFHSRNFEEDSIIIYENHGASYSYRPTYVLPKALSLYGFVVGTNIILIKKIQLGLIAGYSFDNSATLYQGSSRNQIIFTEFISYGLQLNYKLF